jgi:anti-anti-sigma regulatory factor
VIVYTKDDTVKLSGALTRNHWPTIKAAAHVLMKEHPEGILIDGGELTTVTPEGARTFLDALRDIEAAGARMVVCNLPPSVMEMLKRLPGVRSQLPFSMSVEEARESLRTAGACAVGLPRGAVVVPVLETADTTAALRFAAATRRDRSLPVALVGFVAVPREVPLASPMPEEESQVQSLLAKAAEAARSCGVTPCTMHVERVRDLKDGLLHALAEHEAAMVVLALRRDRLMEEDFIELAELLLRKAPCEVVVARVLETAGETPAKRRGGQG